ncbi:MULTISPECIES: hypothetical protein [Paenarthrobacter]|jgi:hypothetical protein|uniref:hypothetical protein n=1 Tax=Paenarthrobacter TaxID=1742992 RepID=UPI0018789B61|nr:MULTISPECIES: hypothetical protein [Paenarthrobacter]QOT15689.1 hypothetical protein HMI59_03200 [Paenarthrobacter sp. YJN-5]UOD80782.1 hypothetical protein MQZ73_16960 [Paenarthrobacter ureafaciens]WNZ03441.1 hypothetical protein PVT25_17630 [Paenarthrobacter ureafaciens]
MHKPQTVISAAQELAGEWVRHAADGKASQSDAVVGWALSRINHADVPSVVQGVMMTLTGNRRTARKARRAANKAVKRATQALADRRRGSAGRTPSRRGLWLTFIAAAGLSAGAVFLWRTLLPQGEPTPVSASETAANHAASSQEGTN